MGRLRAIDGIARLSSKGRGRFGGIDHPRSKGDQKVIEGLPPKTEIQSSPPYLVGLYQEKILLFLRMAGWNQLSGVSGIFQHRQPFQ